MKTTPLSAPRVAPAVRNITSPRRIPLVEPLEQRIAPAVATFTGAINDDWSNAGNWDIARVPGLLPTDAADLDVIIDLAGTHTVAVNGTFDVKSLTVGGDERLSVAGFGTLTLQTTSSFAAGFDISGGTLNAVAGLSVNGTTNHSGGRVTGNVTNHGTWEWSQGNISGEITNASDGIFSLTGAGNKRQNGGTFTNAGSYTLAGSGQDIHGSGVFNNLASGTVTITTDSGVMGSDGSAGAFNNAGLLRKTAGVGETYFGDTDFNNAATGVVTVTSGSLRFGGGGTSLGGTFNVSAGTQVIFTNAAQTWSGTYTGSGAGNVTMATRINPGADGLTLNFPAGIFQWGGNGSGGGIPFGTGEVTNTGFITLTGPNGSARMEGTIFLNSGTITEASADVRLSLFGGSFTNLASGVFDIQRDGVLIDGDGNGHFINEGVVTKTGGVGEGLIQVPFDNRAEGILDVNSGTLAMVGGGTSTGGDFRAGAGAGIEFRNSPQTWSGTFTGSGPGTVSFYGGTVNIGSAGLILDFPQDVLLLGGNGAGGSSFLAGGTITNLGYITLAGPGGSVRPQNATLNNAGTIIEGDDDVNVFLENATFNNLAGGVFEIQRDGTLINGNGTNVINNAGLIRKSASFETTFHTGTIEQPLNNTGTVEVSAGNLSFSSVTNLAGGLLTGGTWRVIDADVAAPNSSITFPQNITTNAATITLDGTTAQIAALNTFATNNGTLELRGGRDFTRTGAFTNNGTLSLGPASNFNVTGAFTSGASSRVEFLLGGNPVSGNFGTLTVGGAASLAGTAAFTLADGFGPASGQNFTLATFGSSDGDFAAYEGLTLQRTDIIEPTLSETNLVLEAVGDVGDLDVTSVTAPPTGVSGSDVTINWTVTNNGPLATFTTTWTDSVYLSLDDQFDASDKLIGRVEHDNVTPLGVGGSYNGTLTAPLPGAIPGGYRVLVVTDSRGEEPDSDRANNADISAVITTDVPALTPGVASAGMIESGEDKWFRVNLPQGQTPRFTATYGVAGAAEFYLRKGDTPDRATFDRLEFSASATTVDFTQFGGSTGTYYVLLHGREAAGAGQSYSLTAEGLPFGISSLDGTRGANVGSVTTVIHGSLFTPQTSFTLVPTTGPGIPASTLNYVDSSTVWATFNLTGAALGAYDVVASSPGGSDTLDDGFNVVTGVPGKFSYSLSAPQYIRDPFRGAIVTLTYENTGDTDVTAPLVLLSSENATFFPPGFAGSAKDFFELLAANPNGPAGVLPPGAKNVVQIPFIPNQQVAHALTPITASVMNSAGVAIDWDALKGDLQPLGVPDDAWNVIFTNYKADVGGNYATYSAALADSATRLSLLGQRTLDPGPLVAFEMQQAADFGKITDRFAFGLYGFGPVSQFEMEALTDAAGNVVVQLGGDVRNFAKQANGSFLAMPGYTGTLTKDVSGLFHLVEGNGIETVFRADGKFLSSTDLAGKRITASYNGNGQVTSVTTTDNDAATVDGTTNFTLNADGKIATKTDPYGRLTTYTYDAGSLHLLSASSAAGTTQYTYATTPGAQHALASITYPDGTHTFFQYDARGRVTQQTRDGGAEALTFTYDSAGGVTVTNALGQATRTLRDANGDIARLIDPFGQITSLTRELDGDLIGTSNPAGATATLTPGSNHLPSGFRGPSGSTSFDFEGTFDRLESFTHANGGTTSYLYDAAGKVTEVVRPDGTRARFAYNDSGNIIQMIAPSGEVTVQSYNADGLLSGKVFPDGSTISYTYDAHRNLETITDGSGTITYAYDAADRVTKVTYPGGKFVSYTYDSGGRRASITDQSGFGTKYTYDAVGRLASITDQSDVVVTAYTYDLAGRLATETQANGAVTEYSRDNAGRVTGIAEKVGPTTIRSVVYTYDAAGRIATATEGAAVTSYDYDLAGQLVKVTLPSGRTIAYTYDAQGNRVSVVDSAGGTTSYTSNVVDEYTAVGGATFTYDTNGRLSTKTDGGITTIYRYDARGRLALQFSPTESIAYEYDALGNLRATTNAAGERTTYLVDPTGLGNVFAEYNAAGDVIAHYRRGAGLESRVDGTGAQAFYHFDAIGNTRELTGTSGTVLNSYSYLPFGEKLAETESVANPFTFNGRAGVQELNDGFYFMRARSYDPELGRFIESDPIGVLGADTNFFRFANNDPINHSDPSGLITNVALSTANTLRSGIVALDFFGGATVTNVALNTANTLRSGVLALDFLGGATVSNVALNTANTLRSGVLALDFLGEATITNVTLNTANTVRSGVLALDFVAGAGEATALTALAAPAAILAAAIAGPHLVFGALEATKNSAARVDDPFAPKNGYDNPGFRPRDIIDSPAVREKMKKENLDPNDPEDVNIAIRGTNDKTREEQYEEDFQKWLADPSRPKPQPPTLPKVVSELIYSGDPNNIYGPSGFGADAIADDPNVQTTRFEGFIKPTGDFAYKIVFENMPTASASAQFVEVTQTLDSDLDPATLKFTSFGWGDVRVEVPADHPTGAAFTQRVDVRDIYGIFVDVAASVDTVTGAVRVSFTAVDPVTGDLPLDALAGFLPPNVTPPEGDGFINYTVKPDAGLADGTEVKAKARIVFDTNPFIDTPEITNKTDATAPTSAVTAFTSATSYRTNFKVQWSGADAVGGSGLATYDVFYSDNGGPLQFAFAGTTATSGRFTGQVGHTYEFFVTAADNVGNVEVLPTTPDATIAVVAPPLLTAPGNKITLTDTDGDKYTIKLTGPGTLKYLTVDPDGAGPLDGPLDFLVAESTTTKSNLSVTVVRAKDGPDPDKLPDGDGVVTIGDVQIAGSLGGFTAKASDLNVNGFVATGTVKSIVVRDLLRPDAVAADPLIDLGGTNVDKTAITARSLASGFVLETPGVLSSLKAADIGDGTITSASLGKLDTTAGGMDAELTITGTVGAVTVKGGGVNAGNWTGAAFGAISVTGGALDADIDTAGSIAKITVKGGGITGQLVARSFGPIAITDGTFSGVIASTTPAVDLGKIAALKALAIRGGDLAGDVRLLGALGSLTVKANKAATGGNISGASVVAARFGSVTVANDVTNSLLLAGADLGSDFALGGVGMALDVFGAGSMGVVKIGGDLAGSTIGVGLVTADATLGNGDDEILGGNASALAGLTIGGPLSGGSSVSAGLFKGKPKIAGVVATPTAITGGFRLS